MSEKRIIEICNHARICRISIPPEGEDIEAKLEWLHQRFGASLSQELISNAMNSIIKAFDAGLKNNTVFEFSLIVRVEMEEPSNEL